MRHGEILTRRNFEHFFLQINHIGYDGNTPDYVYTIPHNQYLSKICFKSNIPYDEWLKKKSVIEMFLKTKIYKIKNLEEDITVVNIFYVEEKLPTYIEWNDSHLIKNSRNFAIGESYGERVIWDVENLQPHGIVAGATGGGKTGILRCLIHQAIQKRFNVSVINMVVGGDYAEFEKEYRKYKDIENGQDSMIVSEPEKALELLRALKIEVDGRMEMYKKNDVKNIDEYNKKCRGIYQVPWLVVIDEAAEILDVKPKDPELKKIYTEIDSLLRPLMRTSRKAGLMFIMGIIRPDSNVLDGQIKNNMAFRASSYIPDPAASRIILDNDLASKLPTNIKGRFIVGDEECQAYYLPTPEERNNQDE